MSWDDIKVKIRSYFEGKGYASWIKSSNEAATSAAKATSKATALAGVMGSMDGALGKAASGVASVAQGFAMLGPAGAMVAGLKAIIDLWADHATNKVNKFTEAVERMAARVSENFDKLKSKTLEEINEQLAKATTEAAAAASRFDALASSYMKVSKAKDAVAKSGGSAAVSGLALEKAQKMSDVKDKDEKAVVGAGYDVRIAEAELANTRSEQDRNVSNVRKEAKDASKRKKMSINDEREAQKALDKATSKYNRFKDASVDDYDKGTMKELEAKKKEAENALTAATNKRIKADADAEAAELKVTEAENNRVTAINNSLVALQNARDTENELKAAQKEAARAILEKARMDPQVANYEKSRSEKIVREAEDDLGETRRIHDAKVSSARNEMTVKEDTVRVSTVRETEARASYAKARREYDIFSEKGAESSVVEEKKATVDKAKRDLDEATKKRAESEEEAENAARALSEAERRRVESVKMSISRLEEARLFDEKISNAQEESVRAQKERAKAEKDAADAARRKAEADAKAAEDSKKSNALSSFKSSSRSKFEAAFDLWRDPEAAAAAVESDKKRSADLKAFDKAVNRYGGKGKIDEYAALMRSGDEEGMQSRLDQWRKSSKFTPQVEQMVKAEAARQNENAADRALANIEKNTANLDKKLDQLLSIK